MTLKDPYHGDPWVKRGRRRSGDSQIERAENIAEFRQTRKKARRMLKEEIEREQAQIIDEMIKDCLFDDLSDIEYWEAG